MTWIKNIIHNILEKYETNEPTELADLIGINILYEFLEDLQGYYVKNGDLKFIVVNSNLDYYDQRLVIAHELGHALLHPELNTSFMDQKTFMSTDKYEHQANEFAAHLLLPDGFENDPIFRKKSLEQIAGMVGLPVGIVRLKVSSGIQ